MSSALESESCVYFMKFTNSTLSGVMFCGSVDIVCVIFGNLGKRGVGRTVKLIALDSRITDATGLCGLIV